MFFVRIARAWRGENVSKEKGRKHSRKRFVMIQVVKVFLVVALGFICSMHCVAYTVLFLRAAQGTVIKSAPPAEPKRGRKDKPAAAVVPSKPFSDDTMAFLLKGSIITGGLSIAATRNGNDWASPLQSIFHILATFATYVWGARLPPGFNKTVHPLITSTVLTLGVIRLTGMATGSSFLDVLKTFKVGNLDLMTTGAGDMLLFLLGPTVVGFAVSMYSRKTLLKENFLIVMAAMLVSSVFSLFGTAAVVKAIQLGGSSGFLIRLSVLARNVTTDLAMAITTMLGGDVSIIAVVVVMSGIIGATYGRRLLDYMGIVDPIARGLALGSSGQGLGVSSMVSETDAFPFAAMGLVLNAVLATLLVSIPAVKEILVNLCK
jgi:putative effector of murein hydrolase